ncbi:GntR family transcriptional regulator [Grimontia sp. NTOU-MAR1]|uniref:GntR family transcriptional regulator n=1 Tax=Grimontia sp. NTOU-MAR1 TaxID=3111011 RepID=UPI002DBE269F|nr:GntR family transcriptional regulator [Grimontia sp. NTOU-MAR1]WRW00992.1 GntR family transcriptional regulator [Grimontia sp. NTOU-MAR1]
MARRNNVTDIYDELRSRIVTGELRGGTLLHEDKLGKEFQLSRTPIRQALQKLAYQNLVETKTGVGTLVVPDDRFDLIEDIRVCRDILQIAVKRNSSSLLMPEDKFELFGLIALQEDCLNHSSVQLLWSIMDKSSALIEKKIDHDLLRKTYDLLITRIQRRVFNFFSEDLSVIAEIIYQELEMNRKAENEIQLIKSKLSTLSLIKSTYSRSTKAKRR